MAITARRTSDPEDWPAWRCCLTDPPPPDSTCPTAAVCVLPAGYLKRFPGPSRRSVAPDARWNAVAGVRAGPAGQQRLQLSNRPVPRRFVCDMFGVDDRADSTASATAGVPPSTASHWRWQPIQVLWARARQAPGRLAPRMSWSWKTMSCPALWAACRPVPCQNSMPAV